MKQIFDINRVCIDGIDVAYCQFGEGAEQVVIAQGWGTNFKMYKIMADALSDSCTVTLFDFPGFGMTPEPETGWSVERYSLFFVNFLEALSIRECVLIGHSFGGRVVIETAASDLCMSRIKKIVLVDSAGVMPERSAKSKLKTKCFKGWKKVVTTPAIHGLFPEVIDDWLSRQGSEDYRNASPLMKQVLVKAVNYDQKYQFSEIKQPVLLIWGENDDATPLTDAKIMESEFERAKLVVIEGAGHFSYAENPYAFRSAVREFLELDKDALELEDDVEQKLGDDAETQEEEK